LKVPAAVGVPLMVIVLDDQEALTPAGKPVAVPIPVAPVVAIVIFVNAVLIHTLGLEEGEPAVLLAVTVMVPVAFTLPQPPVNGIE